MFYMDESLERAQIIIDAFRRRTIEIQEQLIAEQVAHELTKRQLSALVAQIQNQGE